MSEKRFVSLLVGLTGVFLAVVVSAQPVTMNVQLLNRDIQVFFLSDFNFTGNATASNDIFYNDSR